MSGGIDWREGFRRIGLVTAGLYWAIALLFIGLLAAEDLGDEASSPFGPPIEVYISTWSGGGQARVKATSNAEAERLINNHYAFSDPPARGQIETVPSSYDHRKTIGDLLTEVGKALGIAALIYGVLALLFRGLGWIGSGFLAERSPG